mmetsp:Transcript_19071/g.44845  ORF Transcript_19071/g.44845 Transcript_19071/m.44845 type:complete len:212 (+) Transcript_19071:248-883(+)
MNVAHSGIQRNLRLEASAKVATLMTMTTVWIPVICRHDGGVTNRLGPRQKSDWIPLICRRDSGDTNRHLTANDSKRSPMVNPQVAEVASPELLTKTTAPANAVVTMENQDHHETRVAVEAEIERESHPLRTAMLEARRLPPYPSQTLVPIPVITATTKSRNRPTPSEHSQKMMKMTMTRRRSWVLHLWRTMISSNYQLTTWVYRIETMNLV